MGGTRSLHKNDFLCLCDKWQMLIYSSHKAWVGTSYMIPIVYRDIDSYSVPRLCYGGPRYLAYFCVLGCLSVLASFSYLAYQPLFAGNVSPRSPPQKSGLGDHARLSDEVDHFRMVHYFKTTRETAVGAIDCTNLVISNWLW